ncbi:DUF4398 domain-containing protein [Solimonas sp. K1W22B-7]|uniref:DUF4398 domain-containing protein n=1 Tax=Solimonas sp. K1W22B-7 TaxID=2303331 RepID=UPI000E330B68|nr:DUF4398 domain-containing protein [Solimonas sp. K1W22B-7]AXQ30271.1 DUF4398 domain-containing protein [Solimonas sp. K1W22B-7]
MKAPTAVTLAPLALVVTLAACSGKPVRPDEAMEAAEVAVGKAGNGTVAATAQPQLTLARDKLGQARAALKDSNYPQAQRLAEQARADAELAIALGDLAKAKARLSELQAPARPAGAP